MATRQVTPDTQAVDLNADRPTAYWVAMERAFSLLAIRPRTEHRLRERLASDGVAPDTVDEVVGRLLELGLVDDLDFAHHWIAEHRRGRRRLGAEALIAGLEVRGVRREVAEQALADLGFDEHAEAIELASGLVDKLAGRPLAEQGPRLVQMLLRRGFSEEVAQEGARAALPPEGWD